MGANPATLRRRMRRRKDLFVFNDTIEGPHGNPAALRPPVFTRYTNDIFITNGGSGYTLSEAVSFTGGNPTESAVATTIGLF
jgi:hypothetical protein